MSDKIVAIFQFLERSLGMHPATVAAISLLFAVVFALLALYGFVKLRKARGVIRQLAERLGYEPPYGDGAEVLHKEIEKETVEHDKEIKFGQLEKRIAELEAEAESKDANLAALQLRTKDLESQLQQAFLHQDKVMAVAGEKEQAHRVAVEQLEQRILQIEAEKNASVAAHEQHAKDLENQLQQAYFQIDKITAVANDQAQAHRKTAEQFEQRMREMENQGNANLTALQRRTKELEDQLQQAIMRNENAAAQASEQAKAHRATVEQLEQRIREIEAESNASVAAHAQRSRDLEYQLQQASLHNDQLSAQAEEQARAYRSAVEQHEQRVRQIEAESHTSLIGLRQRAKELEEQLERAAIQNNQITTRASEQAQAHRSTVEQLEQRIRQLESESGAGLAALQQRAKELEDQLQEATLRSENEKALAQQEALERVADMEQLTLRMRGLEAEKEVSSAQLNTLQARVKELEGQLQQAADGAANREGVAEISAQLLHRAEWITARAVGGILPHGLVAAEAYASAAVAADPHGIDAPQLLAELARIHRAYREGLPPVVEAVTTFDERAATFFGADLSRTADIADDEAQRRARAGLNRSALLAANVAIEIRQKTDGESSPALGKLQELKASLLARLGDKGKP